MKQICYLVTVLIIGACNPQSMELTQNDIEYKVDSLLSIMTLQEKIGQLNMYNGTWEFTGPIPADDNSQEKAENIKMGLVGGMLNVLTAEATREAQKLAVDGSRLGIPLIFGYDVIHGYKTMLPIPLAQAASWNPEVGRVSSAIAAREMAASGLHWAFGPVMDVAPDGRWGRIMEGAGEDPYLTSIFARAWVQGFQGDDLSSVETVAACAKHFAAYGFAEAGLDYSTVDISNQTLYNVALPPFKAAVDAGVATVMNAFNEIGGIPATAHQHLQRDILKGAWEFDGLVLSDWASINELIIHGYARDASAAAKSALLAGCDMDMESKIYEKELEGLITSGELDESLLDDAVRRILKLKFQLGLFDDPYRYSDPDREKSTLLTEEHLKIARETARESIVLLKNESNILPLKKTAQRIAVIGQLANSKDVVLGSWRAQAEANSGISILEGIQAKLGSTSQVDYAKGYTLTRGERTFRFELDIVEGDKSNFPEAVKLAEMSDVVVLVLGEDCFQSGEGRSQVDIALKGTQEDLLREILKVNKSVVAVLMNGRPLAIPYVAKNVPAVVESWYLGSEMGHAVADVLFGDYNPSGKLPASFPYHVGQEPLVYYKKNSGRPVPNEFDAGMVFWEHYTDSPKEALFPFGHGLSYSTFEYSNLELSVVDKGVNVSVSVTNTSDTKGTETVQVYIRDIYASETRPAKELVDFKKVTIAAGETITATFTLDEDDLGFYHSDYRFFAEDGEFKIMVGGNSADLMETTIELTF